MNSETRRTVVAALAVLAAGLVAACDAHAGRDTRPRPPAAAAATERNRPVRRRRVPAPSQTSVPVAAPSEASLEVTAPVEAALELPGEHAASCRQHFNGSIKVATRRLIDATAGWDGYWAGYYVAEGWGSDGVVKVLEGAVSHAREHAPRQLGAYLHALSSAHREAHDLDGAGDALIESVLAMKILRHPAARRLPELATFAGGPNIHVLNDERLRRYYESDRGLIMLCSGGGGWYGGSDLLDHCARRDSGGWYVGQRHLDWARASDSDESPAELAMAASIWTHATALRSNTYWEEGLPPAATRLVLARRPDLAQRDRVVTPAEWRIVFAGLRGEAREAGAAWETSLRRYEEALDGDTLRASNSLVNTGSRIIVWSLAREFEDRWSDADSPTARRLRALAAELVALPAR